MILLQLGRAKKKWYSETTTSRIMNRSDGMPTEIEWKIFPGITTSGLVEKIESVMRDLQCEPEHFFDRIIFMPMYNDIAWGEKANTESCENNSQAVAENARKFPGCHWSFLEKRNCMELTQTNPTDPETELQRI